MFGRVTLLLIAAVLAAPAVASAGGPAMALGATEDVVRQADPVKAKEALDLAKLAGFDSIRISQIWAPGETKPSAEDLLELRTTVNGAILAGIRPYVSVSNFGSRTTPLTDEERADFAAFAAAVVREVPALRDVIVGNEPNLNRFWLPQYGPNGEDVAAPAYERLLAETYDAIKAASPEVTVYGGAVSPRGSDNPSGIRPTHSPTAFIPDMGAAYRESGRTKPIMDAFAFHPYTDFSSQPPATQHPNTTTVALADYGKLVALLGRAFDGTAQPGSTLPILYDEFGVESLIPTAKSSLYTGVEPTTTRPVDEKTQAEYYKQAIALAFCQPNVVGMLMFHVVDEPGLPQWQSGVFYVDRSPKASLQGMRVAIGFVRRGIAAKCPGMKLPVKGKLGRVLSKPDRLGVLLSCDIDCNYVVRLVRTSDRRTLRTATGRASGRRSKWVLVTPAGVPTGRYRFTVSLVAPLNPAQPTAVSTGAFAFKRV